QLGDPDNYRDPVYLNKMNQMLHDWRLRRKRVYGESGSFFDVENFISDARDRVFMSRVKMNAANKKILFLLDFSSSMSDRQEDYKRVMTNTLEIFQNIHVPTAVFGFGAPTVDFFKIKEFNQPWSREQSEQLAGLQASGGTPLGASLNALDPYINRYRPKYVVVVTDGQPGDKTSAEEAIKRLSKKTNLVAFGLGNERLGEDLRNVGFKNLFSTEDVNDIPKQLMPKIAPTKK
ncbi:MAG: vWA domain-containing protein, partial [Rhabdochlamydiaceae bacterium]